MIQRKILLFSKSPRRSQLLREAGFQFEVVSREVDESYPADLEQGQVAEYIARKKARAARELLRPGEVILTADTVVVLEGRIYEKPVDKADGQRMLRELSGKVHEVITGVCLVSEKEERSFSVRSKVHFSPLSEAEIVYYLETYQPYDKAGAYGIQEWIGLCKIERIEGTYPSVMGLPVDAVYRELATLA